MWSKFWLLLAALALALLAGCGDMGSDDAAPSGAGDYGGCPGCGGAGGSPGSGDVDGSPGAEPGQGGGGSSPQAGQLTAGEWRDLDHWDFWRGLLAGEWSSMETYWGYRTATRVPVLVHDAGVFAMDAEVELLDAQGAVLWTARTDAWGHAELWSGLFEDAQGPFTVRARSGEATAQVGDLEGPLPAPVELQLEGAAAPAAVLDVAFLVDTTGSMSDELRYLQVELADVVERVRAQEEQNLEIRVGLGFYRDHGDEYVVRDFPFTTDIDEAVRNIGRQSANGGGDFPEAVEEGLETMITQGQWSASARARLLFVVLDAPPHYQSAIVRKLQGVTRRAAEQGIRIVPLAASGVDTHTEFLLRMLAISTGGTYTFLTDHSGIGNPHLEPTIGEYQVEMLNDLLVRVIGESLGE